MASLARVTGAEVHFDKHIHQGDDTEFSRDISINDAGFCIRHPDIQLRVNGCLQTAAPTAVDSSNTAVRMAVAMRWKVARMSGQTPVSTNTVHGKFASKLCHVKLIQCKCPIHMSNPNVQYTCRQ